MRISIKAKTSAKKELVERLSDNEFVVSVKEPPIDVVITGIARAIAEHFGVSPSRVSIISGQTSKNKILEIKYDDY